MRPTTRRGWLSLIANMNDDLKKRLAKAAAELAIAKKNLLNALGLPPGTELIIRLPVTGLPVRS